jgi:hypothetical protein
LVFFLVPLLAGIGISSGLSTVSNPINVATNRAFPVLPQNPNQLIANLFRGQISEADYFDQMLSNGFDQQKANLIRQGQLTLLDAREYLTLFRRGKLGNTSQANREAFEKDMTQLGFSGDVINKFVQSQEVIESPQQIITFLVREVLNPQLRRELDLDAEFPESSLADFAKIGISEQLARRIWAAHWELPDVSTMTTALHRYPKENRQFWEDEIVAQGLDPNKVETSVNDIKQLLKFKDVGTRYREQVMSTLFNDAGQIQLRWLIRFRFIDYKTAVYRHQRQGLPLKIAEQITKVVFVVQSITDWKTGISKGAITFDDVLTELQEWNITEENIIRIVKLKVADDIAEGVEEERKLSKSIIFDAYDLGETSRLQTLENLKGLNYSDEQAKFMLEVHEAETEIKRQKEAQQSGLTVAEIKRAFRSNKLTFNQAVDELVKRGKTREAANIIIQIESDALG